MAHSNGDSVLPGREPKGVRSYAVDAEEGLTYAGGAARELLRVRGLGETERRVLGWVRECSGAAWAALYRRISDAAYGIVISFPDDMDGVPEVLAADDLHSLLEFDVAPCIRQLDPGGPFSDPVLVVPLPFAADRDPPILICGPLSPGGLEPREMDWLRALADAAAMALHDAELIERLQAEVFVDVVTGCYNRRAFEEHLMVELARARRYERPLTLLLLDLDHFKRVNDVLGHPAGDHVLRKVGEVLRTTFRTTDRVSRYGGDEFALIFPETPKEDAIRLAERLRGQIAALFPDTVVPHPITGSIGVAGYPRDAARPNELVRLADLALYEAKSAGRDRVVSS
jgi:diguanylate cyclase (GGDEF)-like protein